VSVRFTNVDGGVRFAVKVVPGSSRDRVVGPLGEALKVAVSKPPQGGAANDALVALLADVLGVAPGQVTITRGHGSPRKEILVRGLNVTDVSSRLARWTVNLSRH
jgi:uncharacterized protein (TIGR00251 family)